MSLEHQFAAFLVDRIETKVGEIKKQTMGESTKFVVDEVQLHIDQLKLVISSAFDGTPNPRVTRVTRRRSQGGDKND